jgi:hypothetical protein
MELTFAFTVATSSTFWSCTGSDAIDVNDEAGRIATLRGVEASAARLICSSITDRRLNSGLAST